MGLGYFRRKRNDYQDPLISPGQAYRRDHGRWFRALLIVLFLLFDLLGGIILFFPQLLLEVPKMNIGPQIVIVPTQAGKLLQQAGSVLSPTASASRTPGTGTRKPGAAAAAAAPSSSPTQPSTPASVATGLATSSTPGLYLKSLRTDPQTPRRNQDIYFYVTFLNTTGIAQTLRWDVLVYRPGNLTQYFGQSLPVGKGDVIGAGIVELRSSGPYRLFGAGGCQDVVVRIARMDGDKPGALITLPDGNPFQQTYTLCP